MQTLRKLPKARPKSRVKIGTIVGAIIGTIVETIRAAIERKGDTGVSIAVSPEWADRRLCS
ncbi:hypothetical protein GCM10011586_01090 [Silvibacterium dinghuense]|nr:hypothetical protein GCM10011586_01090 [Silvibacterium dinghuense]